jgi:hypothetical protein
MHSSPFSHCEHILFNVEEEEEEEERKKMVRPITRQVEGLPCPTTLRSELQNISKRQSKRVQLRGVVLLHSAANRRSYGNSIR